MRSSRTDKWRTRPIPSWANRPFDKLLDVLDAIRSMPLAGRCRCSGASTLNIGTIHGGRAPNVIPDEAHAEIFVRLVGDSALHQGRA